MKETKTSVLRRCFLNVVFNNIVGQIRGEDIGGGGGGGFSLPVAQFTSAVEGVAVRKKAFGELQVKGGKASTHTTPLL